MLIKKISVDCSIDEFVDVINLIPWQHPKELTAINLT